jgi:hypothetical protein
MCSRIYSSNKNSVDIIEIWIQLTDQSEIHTGNMHVHYRNYVGNVQNHFTQQTVHFNAVQSTLSSPLPTPNVLKDTRTHTQTDRGNELADQLAKTAAWSESESICYNRIPLCVYIYTHAHRHTHTTNQSTQ